MSCYKTAALPTELRQLLQQANYIARCERLPHKTHCAKLDARMSKITVQLTPEELQALVTLTENQFFRIKYLDPKMPGYKGRPKEVEAAQSAVHVLQAALRKEKGFKDLVPK